MIPITSWSTSDICHFDESMNKRCMRKTSPGYHWSIDVYAIFDFDNNHAPMSIDLSFNVLTSITFHFKRTFISSLLYHPICISATVLSFLVSDLASIFLNSSWYHGVVNWFVEWYIYGICVACVLPKVHIISPGFKKTDVVWCYHPGQSHIADSAMPFPGGLISSTVREASPVLCILHFACVHISGEV